MNHACTSLSTYIHTYIHTGKTSQTHTQHSWEAHQQKHHAYARLYPHTHTHTHTHIHTHRDNPTTVGPGVVTSVYPTLVANTPVKGSYVHTYPEVYYDSCEDSSKDTSICRLDGESTQCGNSNLIRLSRDCHHLRNVYIGVWMKSTVQGLKTNFPNTPQTVPATINMTNVTCLVCTSNKTQTQNDLQILVTYLESVINGSVSPGDDNVGRITPVVRGTSTSSQMVDINTKNTLTTLCQGCTCASASSGLRDLDSRFALLCAVVCACASTAMLLVYGWSDWMHRSLWFV